MFAPAPFPALSIRRVAQAGVMILGLPGLLWGQQAPSGLDHDFPQGIVETLPPDEASSALASGQPLAPELGAALAGENTTLGTNDIVTRLPLSTNRLVSQPLAVRSPRDPLAERSRPKARVQFQIRGGVEHNDNVFISDEDEVDDVVFTVAPTLAVNAGDFRQQEASYLSAAYTATGSAYAGNEADESLDHLLHVSGQLKRKKTSIPYEAQFTHETGSFVDVGSRDTVDTYGGRIGLDHTISSKLSLGVSGEYSATDYRLFADSDQYLVDAYVNYHPSRKTTLSGVYRYSNAKTEGSESQSFNAALARAVINPTAKLNALFEAGVAVSSLDKGDRSDFIYRLALAYQPNRRQRFTLSALRQPSTSAFTVGSGYIENGVQLTFEQALGKKTRLVLNGGYQLQDYFAAEEGVSIDRRDDYFVFSTLLAYDINSQWQAELYYFYSDNDSNRSHLEFSNQRVGMGLTWSY